MLLLRYLVIRSVLSHCL